MKIEYLPSVVVQIVVDKVSLGMRGEIYNVHVK